MPSKSLVTCLGIKVTCFRKQGQAAYTAHVFAPDLHHFFEMPAIVDAKVIQDIGVCGRRKDYSQSAKLFSE